ncbi:MAG: DUF2085 domain-containing protein [Vicinamibacterales bacterium]
MSGTSDRTAARICMAIALAWALMLPLAAFSARPPSGSARTALARLVYGVGSVVCHQRPERSFASWGVTWPVCARCTGIYAGAAAAALMFLVGKRRISPAASIRPWVVVAIGALPSMATLVYEWTTGVTPGNVTRLVAGLPIGLGVIAVIALAAESSPLGARNA